MDRSYGHTQCRCWLYCWWAAGTDFGPRRLTDSPYDAGHHVRLIYPAGRDTAVKTNHIVALRPQKRRLIRNGEPRTATSTFTQLLSSDHWAGHVQPRPPPLRLCGDTWMLQRSGFNCAETKIVAREVIDHAERKKATDPLKMPQPQVPPPPPPLLPPTHQHRYHWLSLSAFVACCCCCFTFLHSQSSSFAVKWPSSYGLMEDYVTVARLICMVKWEDC